MDQGARAWLDPERSEPDRKRRWPFFVILAFLLAVPAYIILQSFHGTSTVSTSNPAQTQLRAALAAANTFEGKHGTYHGFTPKVAASFDPSVTWNDGNTTLNEVSIRAATDSHVLLVAADSGGTFCILGGATVKTTYGSVDAQGAKDCRGATW